MSLLKDLKLENIINQKADSLSTGEKQRLCVARALLEPKDIILCDEIVSALDEESANIIYKKIVEISKDHLVIFVSHIQMPSFFTESANIIEIFDKHINIINKISTIEDGNIIKDKTKKLRNNLLSAFRNERKSLIVFSIVSLIFCLLLQIKGSMVTSFEYIGSYDENGKLIEVIKDRKTDLVYDSFISSTPIFILNNDDDLNKYDGDKYRLVESNIFKSNKSSIDCNTSVGGMFSGIYTLPSLDFTFKNGLKKGRYPSDKNEVVISDVCANFGNYTLNSKINLLKEYTIVGIYNSNDSTSFAKRFQKYDELFAYNISRTYYSFMIESVFTSANSTDGYINYAIENTANNRKKVKDFYSKGELMLSSYILVDKSGDDIVSKFSRLTGKETFYLIAGCYLAFIFIFLLSFLFRNKKKFLLQRYLGLSRKKLTTEKLIIYSIASLFSTLIGYLVYILTLTFANAIINLNSLSKLTIPFFIQYEINFPFIFGIPLIFIFLFAILLYGIMVKKDFSKQLYEAKIQ